MELCSYCFELNKLQESKIIFRFIEVKVSMNPMLVLKNEKIFSRIKKAIRQKK